VADRWRIEVRDNGPGIAQDQHKLIFEKFHQVSNSLVGKPKGTGLGLQGHGAGTADQPEDRRASQWTHLGGE